MNGLPEVIVSILQDFYLTIKMIPIKAEEGGCE